MSVWLLRNSKTARLIVLAGTIVIVLISGFKAGVKLEEETR